jgi:hypothetical protein
LSCMVRTRDHPFAGQRVTSEPKAPAEKMLCMSACIALHS